MVEIKIKSIQKKVPDIIDNEHEDNFLTYLKLIIQEAL
jgi:hypothetical protein